MIKQEEIQVLQSLKGDTYFAQKFGSDIDQMCENIKNDFPIEMGCVFMTETEALKKTLAQTKRKRMRNSWHLLKRSFLTFVTMTIRKFIKQ